MDNKTKIEDKVMIENLISDKEYKPLKFIELFHLLQVPKREREELIEILDQLISQGKIIIDSRGRYRLPDSNVRVGIFSATQRGYGFVIVEGQEEDIFIPEISTMSAMHGDRVMLEIKEEQNGRRQEGVIIKILERSVSELVGTFEKARIWLCYT